MSRDISKTSIYFQSVIFAYCIVNTSLPHNLKLEEISFTVQKILTQRILTKKLKLIQMFKGSLWSWFMVCISMKVCMQPILDSPNYFLLLSYKSKTICFIGKFRVMKRKKKLAYNSSTQRKTLISFCLFCFRLFSCIYTYVF